MLVAGIHNGLCRRKCVRMIVAFEIGFGFSLGAGLALCLMVAAFGIVKCLIDVCRNGVLNAMRSADAELFSAITEFNRQVSMPLCEDVAPTVFHAGDYIPDHVLKANDDSGI